MDVQAENLMVHVKAEDSENTRKAIKNKPQSLIIHELAIVPLMEGAFEEDIILPRLVVCGVRTISPLHYAALRGADSVLAILLSKTSVDHPLSNGSTCLHFACFSGAIATVKMLLDDFKADINKADSYGWPALHYASIGGQLMVVEELCSRGLNLVHRDQDGTTAAYRAKIFGHRMIVSLFNKLTNNHPTLLEPSDNNGNEEKIYSQIKKKRNSLFGSSDNNNSNNEDKRFIEENNYDKPDDLVTKIYCKYTAPPNNDSNSNGNSSNGNNSNGNNSNGNTPTDQLKVGENIYDLPSEQRTSTSSDGTSSSKEKNVKKIQALVESQFKDIFLDHEDDPYLQPINGNNNSYGTVGSSNMQNIGFKTLKYLLRSEFQKLKSSYNTPNATPPSNTNNNTRSSVDERNIYEEITRGTLKENENKWVKGGQTIKMTRNQRPPLPPRTSMLARQQSSSSNEDPKDQKSSFNNDFSHASYKLNLLEETQFVREACFNELVYVLEPGDWQKLARNLPLRNNKTAVEEKIRKLEKQFPKNVRRQARTALSDWNNYYGKNASLQRLVDALKKSGLVEKIKAVEMASRREFNA